MFSPPSSTPGVRCEVTDESRCPTARRPLARRLNKRLSLSPAEIEALAMRVADLADCAPVGEDRPDGGNYDATADDIAGRHPGQCVLGARGPSAALGGVRIGTGPKPRHRFNVAVSERRVAAMRSDAKTESSARREPKRNRRPATVSQSKVPLLPIGVRDPHDRGEQHLSKRTEERGDSRKICWRQRKSPGARRRPPPTTAPGGMS